MVPDTTLNDLIEIKHGYAFSSDFFREEPTDQILLTPGNFHVDKRLYFGTKTKFYDGLVPEGFVLKNGDLLVVMTDLTKDMAILGNAVILRANREVLHNQRIGRVSVKNPDRVDTNFLCSLLNSDLVQKHVRATASRTTVRHTSPQKILEARVPLPPIDEQKKIAEILSTWDHAIEVAEAQLEAARTQKRALMQQLLTGKRRFPEFEREEWKEVKLGELCEIRRGASPRPIKDPKWFSDKGRGWVRISDVTACTTSQLFETEQYLSDQGVEKSVPVEPGELIMSICATISVPRIVGIPVCIHDGFVVFRKTDGKIDREFLYYFVELATERLKVSGQPGTQKNLNTTIVGNIVVPHVSLREQKRIAEVLRRADKEIVVHSDQIAKLRIEKKALIQQLLSGRRRVVVEGCHEV